MQNQARRTARSQKMVRLPSAGHARSAMRNRGSTRARPPTAVQLRVPLPNVLSSMRDSRGDLEGNDETWIADSQVVRQGEIEVFEQHHRSNVVGVGQ